MKLLHLSDLHIGKRLNDCPMLDDQRDMLTQLLDLCVTQRVDAVLLCGDLYDKSIASTEAVELLDWFLTRLAELSLPVIAISGNHDSPQRVAYGSALFAKAGVHLFGGFQGALPKVTRFDEYGPVHFWALPFVKAATVRHYLPQETIETYTQAISAALSTAQVDTSQRNILLAHQFVTAAAAPALSGSESVSVGTVENVDVSCFDAFDYVALGHIHAPQPVGRETVRYSGSPLAYSFREIGQPKCATLVTLGEKGDVSVELLPLSPRRRLRHLTGPLETLLDPANVTDQEDYLWVTLTDQTPILDAIDRVRSVYPNTLKLEYALPDQADLSDLSAAQAMAELSFRELFQGFYHTVTGGDASEEILDLLDEVRKELEP